MLSAIRRCCATSFINRRRFRNRGDSKKSTEPSDVELSLKNSNEAFELDEIMELTKQTYLDCACIQKAKEIILSSEELKSSERVLLLTIEIIEKFTTFTTTDLHEMSEKSHRKSLVMLFLSKTDSKCLLFWKSKEKEKFYTFSHYSMDFEERDEKIYRFIAEFLAESLTRGHSGIDKVCLLKSQTSSFLLQDLADCRGYNPLLTAIEQNNSEIASQLLNLGVNTESLNGEGSAQSLALNAKNYDLLLQMAKSNLVYPEGIVMNELPDEFKEFYKTTEELHIAISELNIERVQEILKNRQHRLRYHFDLSNVSAAKKALDLAAYDIYEILLRHEVFFAEHENQNDGIFSELPYEIQKMLREMHIKHKKEFSHNHLNILMFRSHASHDAMDVRGNMKYVREAYELMAQDPRLNIILKVVAALRKFDIVYDFNREVTNVIDPTTTEHTEGVFYPKGMIFIGARQLLDAGTRCQAIGVIAHELCHFACNIVYNNDAKPFYKADVASREKFEKLSWSCKERKDEVEVVRLAFDCYESDVFLAELIVRVPHMLALYIHQPEMIEKCRTSYPELFDFYETIVVPEMEEAVPQIEARVDGEVSEKDKQIFKYKLLWTFSVILLFVGIIVSVFILKDSKSFTREISLENKLEIQNGQVIYKGVSLKLTDLFGSDSLIYHTLPPDQISQILEGRPLILQNESLSYLDKYINLHWSEMDPKLKKKVLESNFCFQNETVGFERMTKTVPDAFNYLNSDEIKNILDGKVLAVGSMISNDSHFLIERSFNAGYETKSFSDIDHISMNELIDQKYEKFIVLSAEAGTGKTTTFRELTMRIKKKFPGKWVSFIDLKEHTHFFELSTIQTEPLKVLSDILDLSSRSKFEQKVFVGSFYYNQVVFLWNGFDEISPKFSEPVFALMEYVYNSGNLQFVCTRTPYENYFDSLKTHELIHLNPYNEEDIAEFLEKYFTYLNVSQEMIPVYTEKVQNISKSFNLNTPMMLTVIAENYKDPSLFESRNLYEIYQKFMSKKVEIFEEKNFYTQTRFGSESDIKKIYQKYALLSEFPDIVSEFDKYRIMQIEDAPFSDISRSGILEISSETEFAFTHRSFAEYFAANYLIENICYPDDDEDFDEDFDEGIIDLLYNHVNPQIYEFIFNFQKSENFSIDECRNRRFIELLEQKHRLILFHFLKYFQILEFEILLNFVKNDRNVLMELFQGNEKETLYTKSFDPRYSKYLSPNDVMSLGRKFLTNEEDFQKFLNGKNQKGKILFGMAWSGLQYFTDAHRKYNDEDLSLNEIYTNADNRLTKEEHRELLRTLLSRPMDLNFGENVSTVETIWNIGMKVLDKSEIKSIIRQSLGSEVFHSALLEFPKGDQNFSQIFNLILTKADDLMTHDEIFKIYKEEQVMIKSFIYGTDDFGILWDFLVNRTTKAQQKEILMQSYRLNDEDLLEFVNQRKLADKVELKLFHFGLLYSADKYLKISNLPEINENYFSRNEIKELILESNRFVAYLASYCKGFYSRNFKNYMAEIFMLSFDDFEDFFTIKVTGTGLSIGDYLKGLPLIDIDVRSNLKIWGSSLA